jgi:FkbH-like protein
MMDPLIIDNNLPRYLSQKCVDALEKSKLSNISQALNEIQSYFLEKRVRPFRLGIVRTFTIETQTDALKLSLGLLGCNSEIKVGNLNNIEQELLDPNSELLQWKPDVIIILWRIDELIPVIKTNIRLSVEDEKKSLNTTKLRILSLIDGYQDTVRCPLFLSTLPIQNTFDLLDIHNTCGKRTAHNILNSTIMGIASEKEQIHIFDFAGWAAEYGAKAFDNKMNYFACQPIAAKALGSFSKFFARTFRPMFQPSAKVLALDLDNVLWGGILGEDGPSNLQINNDFPGNIYLRIQQRAIELKNTGILLVLLSKNNLSDVEEVFSKLGMPLKLEDFTLIKVNWQEKHLNLKDMAEELSLSLDSIVFVDDQAFEQEQMKFNLPEVKVLQVTGDPLNILNAIDNCWFFDKYRISKEDLLRNRDYEMQSQRITLKRNSSSPEDFLKTLKLVTSILPVKESSIGRVLQMLKKTNQFNLTTKRHSESKVREFLNNSENILLTLSLSDRFGDQGIVGLVIALVDGTNIHVDSFLLSCRAIGRGVEQVLWASFLNEVNNKKANIYAEYIRTPKNSQVSNFLDKQGMVRTNKNIDHFTYQVQLPLRAEFPCWIENIKRD